MVCLTLLLALTAQDTGGRRYVAPAEFETGAREQAERMVQTLRVNATTPGTLKAFRKLAEKGKVKEIVDSDAKYFTCIVNAFLDDDETIATAAWQAMHDICRKHNISSADPDLPFRNPIRMDMLNSRLVRAGLYTQWSEWFDSPMNKEVISTWGPDGATAIVVAVDPKGVDWDRTMQALRAGGAFDDTTRPEGQAFQRVRSMGRSAHPYLLEFIDDEDTGLGRAAVAVLNKLTGRDPPGALPNENTKSGIKAEWEHWLVNYISIPRRTVRVTAEVISMMSCRRDAVYVRQQLKALSHGRATVRDKATAALKACALRHSDLILEAYALATEAEIRMRLDRILERLAEWEAARNRVEANPEILKIYLATCRPDSPEAAQARQLLRKLTHPGVER